MTRPPRPALHLAVGVTGHRPPAMDAAAAERVRPRLDRLFAMLAEAARAVQAEHGAFFADAEPALRLVTPLAEGADQLAAEVALGRGFAVEAVLPLPRDDYRRDFADPASRAAFDRLLAAASRVLEPPPSPGGRDGSYALAGRATLAHSDLLVAVWDGRPARGRGGTAEVVARALRRGVPVIHLSPEGDGPGRIRWTRYGLFVEADDLDAAPSRELSEAALAALAAALLAPPDDRRERDFALRFFRERERRSRPRAEYPLLLAAVGVKRLRRAAFRSRAYAEDARGEWRGFRDACAAGPPDAARVLDPVEAAYGWADGLARHFAQGHRSGHVLNFLLGAAAVLLALSGLLLPDLKLWLALGELAAVAGFVLNTRVGVSREWHRRWLDYRQLAEQLRPMRSLKLLGAARPLGRGGRARPPRWLDWYAEAVWRSSGPVGGRVAGADALARLVVDQELRPQIAYHRAAAHQLHLLEHRLHGIGMALFAGSIFGCVVLVVGYVAAHDWMRANAGAFVALSAGLPALGGAIFGIRVQGDFAGAADRSRATADDLARFVAALEAAGPDPARVCDLVEGAAATMLADLGEWRLAYQRRQLELPA